MLDAFILQIFTSGHLLLLCYVYGVPLLKLTIMTTYYLMHIVNRLLVTRHAPYEIDPKSDQDILTEKGVEVCRNKLTDLLARDVGRSAILISSISRRAVLTTRELRVGLGIDTSYRSSYITAVGIRPEPVENLHDFVGKVLAECGVEVDGRDVLLVAHSPLVDIVDSGAGDGIVEVPDGWVNPRFMPDFAFMAEDGKQNLDLWLG